MLVKLFLLFTLVPIIELSLLIRIGTIIGTAQTIALVIITGALGAWLAREQGLRVIREFNDAIRRGDMPTDSLIDGLLIVVGGALLITPGVITDVIGFALVAPPGRRIIREYVKKRVQSKIEVSVYGSGPGGFYYSNVYRGGAADNAPRRGDDDIIDV